MLREKHKNLAEQYQIREQHYATQMKAKDLERQLLEAKLKQQADIALQEVSLPFLPYFSIPLLFVSFSCQ
jgi:hypothetical protein